MFQRPKLLCTGLVLLGFAFAAAAQAGTSASDFLQPHLRVGEQISHVFSRAISIKGTGFKEHVERVSGSERATVVAIGPQGVVLDSDYRYDGTAAGNDKIRITADGTTVCRGSHCVVDHETSGTLFNPLLWGHAPRVLRAGTEWTATIAEPWELGPSGTETVRVVRIDSPSHTVTLFREGHGSGLSLHDQHARQVTISTEGGVALDVSLVPGESHWSGRTIVRDGIIVADTIMVERDVTLTASDGRKFKGEQRAYTLENLLQDHS